MDELAELLCLIREDTDNDRNTEVDESKNFVEKMSMTLSKVIPIFLYSVGAVHSS